MSGQQDISPYWPNIQKLISKRGLTIREVSRLARYKNPSTIYSMKTGQSKDPSFSTMMRIADALGVSLDDLRPDKEERNERS